MATLKCPYCHGDDFEMESSEDFRYASDRVKMTCTNCGRSLSKGELIDANDDSYGSSSDRRDDDDDDDTFNAMASTMFGMFGF